MKKSLGSLENRFYLRFASITPTGGKTIKMPLAKKRTMLRIFLQFLTGQFPYVEFYNENYLERKIFDKKKVEGVLVRGNGKTMRQKIEDDSINEQINKFREGLYDPETLDGYELEAQTIAKFDEDELDDVMSILELVSDDEL